jgi:hypothetical protein
MLTKGTYRTEISISFELSKVYTAPVVRLWWMIVVCNDFLDFRNLGFGLFCHSTPPYGDLNRGSRRGLVVVRLSDRRCDVYFSSRETAG